MQKISIVLLLFVFLGCAKYPMPNVDFMEKCFNVKIDSVAHLLCVSKSDGYYFVLLDSFGAPKASRVLKGGVFKSTKFLPKNVFYDLLFVESLDIIGKNLNQKEFLLEGKSIKMEAL